MYGFSPSFNKLVQVIFIPYTHFPNPFLSTVCP
jgi:hypothetical protein